MVPCSWCTALHRQLGVLDDRTQPFRYIQETVRWRTMRATESAHFACTGPHLADGCRHMRTPHPRAPGSSNLGKGRSFSAVTALTPSSGSACTTARVAARQPMSCMFTSIKAKSTENAGKPQPRHWRTHPRSFGSASRQSIFLPPPQTKTPAGKPGVLEHSAYVYSSPLMMPSSCSRLMKILKMLR